MGITHDQGHAYNYNYGYRVLFTSGFVAQDSEGLELGSGLDPLRWAQWGGKVFLLVERAALRQNHA